jgi:hypothetical protein
MISLRSLFEEYNSCLRFVRCRHLNRLRADRVYLVVGAHPSSAVRHSTTAQVRAVTRAMQRLRCRIVSMLLEGFDSTCKDPQCRNTHWEQHCATQETFFRCTSTPANCTRGARMVRSLGIRL